MPQPTTALLPSPLDETAARNDERHIASDSTAAAPARSRVYGADKIVKAESNNAFARLFASGGGGGGGCHATMSICPAVHPAIHPAIHPSIERAREGGRE